MGGETLYVHTEPHVLPDGDGLVIVYVLWLRLLGGKQAARWRSADALRSMTVTSVEAVAAVMQLQHGLLARPCKLGKDVCHVTGLQE